MLEFHNITLEDKKVFDYFLENYQLENAELSFSHLYSWGQHSWVKIAVFDECLFIKYDYPNFRDRLLAPIPKVLDNYRHYLEIAFEYFNSIEQPARFYAVSEPFASLFDETGLFEKKLDQDGSEYVYSTESLISLKGKKLQKKRNFINRILGNYPNYIYRDYVDGDYDKCLDLYDTWHSHHDEQTIDLFDERMSISLLLENYKTLNMKVGVIEIDDRIVAFSIGDYLNKEMAHIHVEKAVNDIDGIYPLINQEFLKHNFSNTVLVNREEDMGLEGLRKAKLSYCPIKMIEKYYYTKIK